MIITAALAQKIVDNITPIVRQNVNIMNSEGVIIASGQAERLQTRHQGAIAVIAGGREVEIRPEDVAGYPGAQPGLNWPIALDGQVVGVVGLSGHPDAMRDTARIVKMVAELLLEREGLVEKFRDNLQLREQLLQLLLASPVERQRDKIAQLAALLRFDLQASRCVAVVDIGPVLQDARRQYGAHELVVSRTEAQLAEALAAAGLLCAERDLCVFRDETLVVLKGFAPDAAPEDFCAWGAALQAVLDPHARHDGLPLGIGGLAAAPEALRRSYEEALYARRHGRRGQVACIYEFDLLARYLLSVPGALDGCLALARQRQAVGESLCVKYDMPNTVNALLDNNLNVTSAARALYIHRNTLVFRLAKLKQATGLQPERFFSHAVLCRILFSVPAN